MARVVLAKRARGDILDLDWHVADAADEALGLLQREPEAGRELRGRLRGLRSLHIGSYRLIYQLSGDGQAVRVLTVRHRAAAYRADPQ